MTLRLTPHIARIYILGAALLIALPSLLGHYSRYGGKILVSTVKTEKDSFFKETVIYLSYHSGWGARGLIINKPLPEDQRKSMKNVPYGFDWHIGGPVLYPDVQFVLIDEADRAKGKEEDGEKGGKKRKSGIKGGARTNKTALSLMSLQEYIDTHPDEWKEILGDKTKRRNFKIYLGYSGWGILQLERELLRGSWGVIDYDPEIVFETKPKKIWKKAFKKLVEQESPKPDGA